MSAPFRHAEAVMGTVVSFDVRHAVEDQAAAAVAEAVGWLHWVDATFSTYRPDSEVCRLDRGQLAPEACHPEVREVLRRCEELRSGTGGYFDARASGALDPSGLVKGWAIERASDRLTAAGCAAHAIDGGGDVRLRGRPGDADRWRVGIVHPQRLDAYCAVLGVGEGAVATSGTYERGFHVLDPHRGVPATDLAAVTVVAATLDVADAYATAALAMGRAAPRWLAGLADADALVIDAEGRGWETTGFGRHRLDVAPAR